MHQQVDSSSDSESQYCPNEFNMASFSRASSVHDKPNVSEAEEKNPRGKCGQCGKPEHTDKMLADQCRLMAAILGQKKSYTAEEPKVLNKDWRSLKQKTPVFPITTEAWREEIDLLTRFSQHNLGFIPSTRPRLSKRRNKGPMLKEPLV